MNELFNYLICLVQDSQECLRCILDALHEALKEEDPSNDDYNKTLTHNISNSFDRKEISLSTPSKTKKDNSYENDKSKNNENSKKESNDQKDKMKYQSIVSDIFEGILLSRVRCKKCRQVRQHNYHHSNIQTQKHKQGQFHIRRIVTVILN
jgi:ubiquitin C-terminal hydrolase